MSTAIILCIVIFVIVAIFYSHEHYAMTRDKRSIEEDEIDDDQLRPFLLSGAIR